METRIDVKKYIGSNLSKAFLNFSFETHKHLEPSLLNLIDIRASQINGCAYCLDMHTKDARAAGETEQRIYTLDAWRETPFFTDRERAALEWTEAVTLVSDTRVPDDVYERVKKQFKEEELVAKRGRTNRGDSQGNAFSYLVRRWHLRCNCEVPKEYQATLNNFDRTGYKAD